MSVSTIAGCIVAEYLVLQEIPKLFSRMIVPFYIPTSSVWVIQFVWILTSFHFSQSDRWWYLTVVLILISIVVKILDTF